MVALYLSEVLLVEKRPPLLDGIYWFFWAVEYLVWSFSVYKYKIVELKKMAGDTRCADDYSLFYVV